MKKSRRKEKTKKLKKKHGRQSKTLKRLQPKKLAMNGKPRRKNGKRSTLPHS